jgi:hypothetical protein
VAIGAAEKAYRQIIAKAEATPADLIAGAMRYAAERDGQPAQYTKRPATWLNQQCWKDEPAPPASAGNRSYIDSVRAGLSKIPDE